MKDGQIDYYGMIRLSCNAMGDNVAKEIIDLANACRNVRGTDRCDAAEKIFECVRKQSSQREI